MTDLIKQRPSLETKRRVAELGSRIIELAQQYRPLINEDGLNHGDEGVTAALVSALAYEIVRKSAGGPPDALGTNTELIVDALKLNITSWLRLLAGKQERES